MVNIKTSILFRQETLQENQNQFGSVLIHQPFAYTLIAVLVGLIVLLAMAFAYSGSDTRKATVAGLLMPAQGMLRITSMESGRITAVKVREGDFVQTGQDLFVLSGDRITGSGRSQNLLLGEQLSRRLQLLEKIENLQKTSLRKAIE